MRYLLYYNLLLRRDVLEKSLTQVSRNVETVKDLTVILSCGGLKSVVEVNVLKSLLFLELMCGLKGNRGMNLAPKREHMVSIFNNFICVAYSADIIYICNFCDSWANYKNIIYEDKGGKLIEVDSDDFMVFYTNLGDYLDVPTIFYRFNSKFLYKVTYTEGRYADILADGMRLV
jgi:hypothetical protein